jgi:tRNA pseudouridine13 synthase
VHTPEDVSDAQRRLEHGELVINGPMDGSKMLSASAQALEIEHQASDALGLEPLMGLLRRELSGTRRPLLITPEGLSGHLLEDIEGLRLKFFLPAGSYATILCEEIYTSP